MNTRLQATWLLAAVLLSCGPNEKLRADYKAAAEAWATKNKLQDPIVTCVADRGSCSVSWSAADGRRVTALACGSVCGCGDYYPIECRVP